MRYYSFLLFAIGIALAGCSNGGAGSPVMPGDTSVKTMESQSSSHNLWGLWQFIADPESGTLDFVRLRTSEVHVNVLPFLEPPAGVKLAISNLTFDELICDVDVTLTHPFPGLSQYTGFDVAGIFISGAENPVLIEDTGLSFPGEGDTRLLNLDGLTRWWNPEEFGIPGPPIMRYRDGMLGTPSSKADFNCTLNAYKMFGDDLDVDNDLLDLGPEHRNQFSHGYSNTRHYTIDFTGGVVFNYAVDANWEQPDGLDPFELDDFPSSANRPEAWAISITVTENTLYNDGTGNSGGGFSLDVDFWDHFNADLGEGVLYIPTLGYSEISGIYDSGDGWARCKFATDSLTQPIPADSLQLVLMKESDVIGYWDVLPDDNISAFFTYEIPVGTNLPEIDVLDPNGGEVIDWDTQYNILWDSPPTVDLVDISYSKDDFVSDINLIEADVVNTGIYDWHVPMDASTTVKIRVEESGGTLSDESDDYFEIFDTGCQFSGSPFTLAQDYSYVPGVWSHNGILCTHKDSTQRIIGRSWPSEANGGIIKIFNASNPLAGAIATYDTGDLIYCNNDQAMWIDKFSVDGYDRIIYNNFGSGSPTAGYQLKTIDWDGSTFSNPQTLPKTGSIWNLCTTPDGDIITHDAYSVAPSFYYRDKSNAYAATFLFQLQQTTCQFGSVGNIREMVYDPELDCVLIFCNNTSVSLGGQLFALDLEGNLVDQDLEVFPISSPNVLGFRVGIDIDLTSPSCRVVLYGGEDDGSNNTLLYHFARYSADLEEKENYEIAPVNYYGPCRGDLDDEGHLWASPHSGIAHFYKFNVPADW